MEIFREEIVYRLVCSVNESEQDPGGSALRSTIQVNHSPSHIMNPDLGEPLQEARYWKRHG